MIDIDKVTPELAASLAASCNEIEHYGDGRYGEEGPRYVIATIWCSIKGEYIAEKGSSVLEAVVKAHNRVNAIRNEMAS